MIKKEWFFIKEIYKETRNTKKSQYEQNNKYIINNKNTVKNGSKK